MGNDNCVCNYCCKNISYIEQDKQLQNNVPILESGVKNIKFTTMSDISSVADLDVKPSPRNTKKEFKEFKVLKYFPRTPKKFSDDELLDKKIMKLNFGIYPYVNELSEKLNFKPFIYVEYSEGQYNSILQVGSFNFKDKNEDVSERTHIWGENNKPGIEFMEKDHKIFMKQFTILISLIQDNDNNANYATYLDLLINFPVKEDKFLTIRDILQKVDPKKDKYLLSKIENNEINCFSFCIDVIKKLKEEDYIILNKEDILDYFERVSNIMRKYKKKINDNGRFNKDIENFCKILGINKKFGS